MPSLPNRHTLSTSSSRISKRLWASYIIDWIIIVAVAALGAGFWKIHPNRHLFSPVDPSLSYPYIENTAVPTWLLAVISLLIPAIITFVLAFALTPGSTSHLALSPSQRWTWRAWEWNTAWMGLALALATAFMATEGMKDLFGKPRPDLLSRCDLDPEAVAGGQGVVGGFGAALPEWNVLVSATACRQTDSGVLRDGFQSFPSGHSSFSWAGMFYLSLYLCAKLHIAIPHLVPSSSSSPKSSSPWSRPGATPPAYLLVIPVIPIGVATWVASTRYSDYRHHGFDILFGSVMGALFAYISFRFYHAPLGREAGWTWAPRDKRRAFFVPTGVAGGYGERNEVDDIGKKGDEEQRLGTGTGNGNGGFGTSEGDSVDVERRRL